MLLKCYIILCYSNYNYPSVNLKTPDRLSDLLTNRLSKAVEQIDREVKLFVQFNPRWNVECRKRMSTCECAKIKFLYLFTYMLCENDTNRACFTKCHNMTITELKNF